MTCDTNDATCHMPVFMVFAPGVKMEDIICKLLLMVTRALRSSLWLYRQKADAATRGVVGRSASIYPRLAADFNPSLLAAAACHLNTRFFLYILTLTSLHSHNLQSNLYANLNIRDTYYPVTCGESF